MSCKSFRDIARAITALPDDSENKKFLVCMMNQILELWRRSVGCRTKNKCQRRHFEDKLEYYWNEYGPKELN